MMFQLLVLITLAMFFLILNHVAAVDTHSNSSNLEWSKKDQESSFNGTGKICGNSTESKYSINQAIKNFKLRVSENKTADVMMNIKVGVYDLNGKSVGQMKETALKLATNNGVPFEKRIVLNLLCTDKVNQFSVREDLLISNENLTFTGISISSYDQPEFKDRNFTSELVYQGLDFPTSMAFLGPDDILVVEKNKGTVQRILNGSILSKPLLDLNVAGYAEDGLVGIAVSNDTTTSKSRFVFLYFTAAQGTDSANQNKTLGNRLYRYELVNNQLINPKPILELPTSYRGIHNGGKLTIGPDNNLYVTVGDIGRGHWNVLTDIQSQNNKTGSFPDGTGGILRFNLSGEPVSQSILGTKYPLNLYYAYGIRNSFGLDFDPVTGNLWDTENGDHNGDEINLVKPGFNSGWSIVEGMSQLDGKFNSNKLVDFDGRGKYSDPEFGWYAKNSTTAVAPTSVKFISSDRYGSEFKNDLLVANFDHGHLYRFDLDKNRSSLILNGNLSDKLSDGNDDNLDIVLGKFPGGITDVQMGPDGYIYVLSLSAVQFDCDRDVAGCLINGGMKGAIFRIVPAN